MSTDSPLDSVQFSGECSACHKPISRPMPGKEHFNHINNGIWVRCSCGKINYCYKE